MDETQTNSPAPGGNPELEVKGTRRSRLGGLLRLVVCLAAAAWLYEKTNWHKIHEVMGMAQAHWQLALLAVLTFGPAPVLIGLRLRWLLAVQDIHLSFWKALKVTFIGNFVIQALPVGTPGGDALKAWYVARETPHKHEAVTVVFFDRVIGVVGLLLLSGVMALANWNNPAMAHWGAQEGPAWMHVLGPRRLIGLLTALLVFGGVAYFSNWSRRALRLEWIISRLPLAKHVQRVDQAVFEFRSRHGRVLGGLLLAVVLQLWAVLSVFLFGWAVGMVAQPEHPWLSFPIYLAYAPICFLCGVLPLGIMEIAFVQLFAQAAGLGSPEAALSLSLVSRFIQLLWSLPGGLVMLTERFSGGWGNGVAGNVQPLAGRDAP